MINKLIKTIITSRIDIQKNQTPLQPVITVNTLHRCVGQIGMSH